MEGYEALKKARENMGYSMREFASVADISLSSLVYYENGKKSLLSMPVKKARHIFKLLQLSIDDFFGLYYQMELDISSNLQHWKETNKREYLYDKLQLRYYNRIFKLKERERFTDEFYNHLFDLYQHSFFELKKVTDKEGYISDESYDLYIIPLNYQIKSYLEKILPETDKIKSKTSVQINECIFCSDYTYKDVANFAGIEQHRFSKCMNTVTGFEDMKIGTVLKICKVFNKRFDELFIDE